LQHFKVTKSRSSIPSTSQSKAVSDQGAIDLNSSTEDSDVSEPSVCCNCLCDHEQSAPQNSSTGLLSFQVTECRMSVVM